MQTKEQMKCYKLTNRITGETRLMLKRSMRLNPSRLGFRNTKSRPRAQRGVVNERGKVMTFEEAYEVLNSGDANDVVKEMEHWHPRVLGQMLIAVHRAKQCSYAPYHPGYEGVLEQLV